MNDYKCNEKMTLTKEVEVDGIVYSVKVAFDVKGECSAIETDSWISSDRLDYDCGDFEIDDNSVEIDDCEISKVERIVEKQNPDTELSKEVFDKVEDYIFDNAEIFDDLIIDELVNGNIDWEEN